MKPPLKIKDFLLFFSSFGAKSTGAFAQSLNVLICQSIANRVAHTVSCHLCNYYYYMQHIQLCSLFLVLCSSSLKCEFLNFSISFQLSSFNALVQTKRNVLMIMVDNNSNSNDRSSGRRKPTLHCRMPNCPTNQLPNPKNVAVFG